MTMHVGCCSDELAMLSLAEAAYSTAILFYLPCNFQGFSPVPTLREAALATVTVQSAKQIQMDTVLQVSRPPVPGIEVTCGPLWMDGDLEPDMQPRKSIGEQARSAIELIWKF